MFFDHMKIIFYNIIQSFKTNLLYPPSQKTTSLPVVECANDRLLRRDVAHNLGG